MIRTPSRRVALAALSAAGLAVGTRSAQAARKPLNLEDPWDNLTGYLKSRSDISGAQAMSWTSGIVWATIPGQPAKALLLGQGLKCTRCIKDERGYEFLERECVIFSDLATGEPVNTWTNPFTERTVEVFHIRNASAGSHIAAVGDRGQHHTTYMENTGDVTFYSDLFYSSTSVLNPAQYAPYSASSVYEGGGIYHYHVRRADLDNADMPSVPCTTSHTGIRQWLPWMEMGQWAGGIVMPSRGKKLPGGAKDIPKTFRAWLEKNSPEFLQAPTLADKGKEKFMYQQFKEHIDTKRKGAG